LPAKSSRPNPLNKHQLKTEATRRKLMNAARRIFARDGFEAARIESIAADAGYTRGAFYAHFKDKEDLFFALLEDQSTVHLDALRAELERSGSNEERLALMRRFYIARLCDRQWAMLVLEFKLYALRHPKLRTKLAQAYRAVREKLKSQSLMPALPAELVWNQAVHRLRSTVLQAVLHGLILEHAYDPEAVPEDQLESMLGSIFDAVVGLPQG
jgi:AcrR family transcriptional regulator